MQQPRIKKIAPKILVGKSVQMSLVDNRTQDVWRSFMLKKNAIRNKVGSNLYSAQVYDNLHYFDTFNPHTKFTKWAAIEVSNADTILNDFEVLQLPEGNYAVFNHKGSVAMFQKTIQYIFSQWLPKSEYVLDHRPHFELLGEKYKNGSPDSEEEIWIPIQKKHS